MLKCGVGRTSAFSLLELLVVVAILSLLSMILIPTVTTAKSIEPPLSNAERMRQIGVAAKMYGDDFDGRVTPGVTDDGVDPQASIPENFPGIQKPWATFAELETPYVSDPSWFRSEESESNEGTTDGLKSDFINDEWAGLRLMRFNDVPPTTTLLRMELPAGADPNTSRVPCLNYGLGVVDETAVVCERQTTAWHDQ